MVAMNFRQAVSTSGRPAAADDVEAACVLEWYRAAMVYAHVDAPPRERARARQDAENIMDVLAPMLHAQPWLWCCA